jgi:phosphoribosylformylglycinamidine cyclo-ligase
MVVNDMITLGALPLSMAMHLAVGSSDWFKNERRVDDLIKGWKEACNLAGCIWGGGETPTLKDIILPQASVISGSALGIIKPKKRIFSPEKISHGDAIVMIGSSGIHANGLTLARKIASSLKDGYLHRLKSGRTFGQVLLDPTPIYVPLIEEMQNCGLPIHYAINITGHGWRKLMRAKQPFNYIVERICEPQEIFSFILEQAKMDDTEAYGNFNMGAGFALLVPELYVPAVLGIARSRNHVAWVAGFVEASLEKKVVIKPKNIEFSQRDLAVR